MGGFDGGEALGGADDAHKTEVGCAGGFECVERLHGGAAGGEHGVHAEHALAGDGREFAIVAPGNGGGVVALEANVANAHLGEEIQVGLEETEAGAEDGHDDETAAEDGTGHGLEGGLDGLGHEGEVARGLESEHEADLLAEGAEGSGLGGAVAQVGEHVGGEGVIEDGGGHGWAKMRQSRFFATLAAR